ncbi:ATP-binding protein [Acinetobacter larvae]|uniref:AAA family ATPase n=1 Tax=Acinetobacter larvae TaxID=1789224 RepID=A0A1B2LZF3_9GAMM|nr:ATP-binding protein [Acinetobacter larvae]AOA58297.1 AAA family ATPase [Acinetobacter larvae]
MSVFFKKAERKNAKLRLALSGPTGSGKTMGALLIAKGIGGKIAVVDTENSSAELYADVVEFDTANIQPPYSPEKFISAIQAAEHAGYSTVILDSITHEWSGVGGCLEIVDALGKGKFKGNTWGAWSEVTPRHRKFIDAMLHSSINIIVTMRSKMDTVQTNDTNGKKKVEKLGLKSEQRDGIEYEFTTVLDITHGDYYANATKDRTGLFVQPEQITEQTGIRLKQWLESGSADATINGDQYLEIENLMIQAGVNIDNYCAKRQMNSLLDLQQQKFEETRNSLISIIQKREQANREHEAQLHQQNYQPANETEAMTVEQRNELQQLIASRGLDVKSTCEYLGIDSLMQIHPSRLSEVIADIEKYAREVNVA